MPISPAKKLTWFVAIGTAFGLLCIVLGVRSQNYALLGAGVLAAVGGFSLILMAIVRQRSGR
jgi:nicotinamide riboside transporter PnuC